MTDDGAETDLDLGHYERFTHAPLSRDNNLTTGPHLRADHPEGAAGRLPGQDGAGDSARDERDQERDAQGFGQRADVTIVEIGGTVGDIESLPFLEAIRQMRQELGRENTVFVHLTLVPWIAAAQELKTKPTQHSVKELLRIGIQADILLCRSAIGNLSREMQQKIAAFCNVEERAVIGATTVPSIYEVPLNFAQEGVDGLILKYLHKEAPEADLSKWKELVERCYHPKDEVSIAIVGKYVEYEDSYKSLKEALTHGALAHNLKLNVTWIEAEGLESKTPEDTSYESQLGGVRRDPGAGRIRQARHRGDAECDQVCAREEGSLFRHLPGHADGVHRVCAECVRAEGREFERVRSGGAASRDLQAARIAGRGRDGRHDAAGRVDLRPSAGYAGISRSTARRRSASGTGIAMSSTASMRRC